MKKLINFTVMCFLAIAAVAQEKADIMVSYDCVSPDKKMKPVTFRLVKLFA